MRQMHLLAEEVASGTVAFGERRSVGSPYHLSRQRAHVSGDRLAEVRVQEVGRRATVGVEEQDPLARRARSADVSGMRR